MLLKSDFDKFYTFRAHAYSGPVGVAPINYAAISGEIKEGFFLGGFSAIKPEIFIQLDGDKWCDILVAGAPSFYLFSDKIIKAFKENSVTGWDAYPVTVKTKTQGDITSYYAFSVTGRAEKADRSLCEKVGVTLPNGKQKMKDKGYFFPLDSWDGSDFFYFKGTPFAIGVTEKVKSLFEVIHATNVNCTRCSEYIWA